VTIIEETIMTKTARNPALRQQARCLSPRVKVNGFERTDLETEQPAAALQKIIWALLLPVPATLLIASGEAALGALITCVLALAPAAVNANYAVAQKSTARFSSGIDALFFFLVSITSCVVAGTIARPQDSKLFRLNYSGFAGEADLAPSYVILLWCFSLATLPALRQGGEAANSNATYKIIPQTAVVLGTLGLIGLALSLTVSRYEVFSSRGETGGNGINSLLYWSAAVFVVYVVLLLNKQDSKAYALVAFAMTMGLLASGNRSPVALIGLALVVRVIMDRRVRAMRLLATVLPMGLVVFSYQSIWRSLVSQGLPSSPKDVFTLMLANPLREFLRLGIDTVDGHALVAALVNQGIEARWTDPLLAIANFVPRQLWEDKPTLLGSTISHDYLGMTAGGIFLSGPGYFSLVTGSIAIGSILFVSGVVLVKRVASAECMHPIVICAIYYLVVRIAIAGDAFDIFLAVQIIVIFGFATLLGKLLPGGMNQRQHAVIRHASRMQTETKIGGPMTPSERKC
jgi:hypothetical protein